MKPEKVLFIDDRVNEFQEIISDFREAGIEVVELDGIQQLEAFLETGQRFDAVILDWYFDDESVIAQLCLRKIKEVRFVPVLVWTEEPEKFDEDLPQITFPHSCIQRVSKDDVNRDVMVKYVSNWFRLSTVTNLSTQWRKSCTVAIEQSLYGLAQLDDKDVIQALRIFIQAGEPIGSLDLDQAIEVLARLLQRELLRNSELSKYLAEKLSVAVQENLERGSKPQQSKILRLHMYYSPNDDFVRNGDVVRFQQGEKGKVALVATPSCDLARPRTEYVRLIVIDEPLPGGTSQRLDRCDLPFLIEDGDVYQNREALFQQVMSFRNLELAKHANWKERPSVMRYSHNYESMGGQVVKIVRITRIDDPYRSDLLQRFAAHASRVGVPEFK
jgi:hypothetical protein